jgi:hypothetical protein
MVVQTRAQSSKLALIAKERDARRTQAQFTHFQMAIGLRKSLEGTGKLWSLVAFDVCGFSTDHAVV